MVSSSSPSTQPRPTLDPVQLDPSYKIQIALVAIGLAGAALVNLWVGLGVGLFGLFLTVQAATLRLTFTATALDIYRGDRQIRAFPYAEWEHWEIFWAPVPILFYFREVNSIHFLPIIFQPNQLRDCLIERCPRLADEPPLPPSN